MVIAHELHADLLLIDESRGRSIAAQEGIRTIGLLGVLIEAKSMKLIGAVRPLMDELKVKARFRIKDELYNEVLKLAGE
jgi:predicted nucleic acid-binding protein